MIQSDTFTPVSPQKISPHVTFGRHYGIKKLTMWRITVWQIWFHTLKKTKSPEYLWKMENAKGVIQVTNILLWSRGVKFLWWYWVRCGWWSGQMDFFTLINNNKKKIDKKKLLISFYLGLASWVVLRSEFGLTRINPDCFFFRISGLYGFHPDFHPDEKYPDWSEIRIEKKNFLIIFIDFVINY